MKVLVLGSGVVGVTSAYYLGKAGHEVTVLDRQPAAGMETSFANAGQVSPGYSAPWAAPGIPVKAIKWMLMRHRPLVMWPSIEPRFYGWLARMLANCTEDAYQRNKGRMVRLAEYSRDILRDLRATTGIAYDHRAQGTLQIFRTQKQVDHLVDDTRVLDAYGVPYEVLDRAGCVGAEPALARVQDKIVGGLRLPGDETGDAHLFTQRLGALCESAGVRFRYGVEIRSLEMTCGLVARVHTSAGAFQADNYVVAMGSFSPVLLHEVGIRLPVYPVKGYSLTLPVINPDAAPVSTVMDETFKVALTRLGNRIRVGGTAELAGFSQTLRLPRRATLERCVRDLFPEGGDLAQARFWTGLRPMTPDGTPIVGRTAARTSSPTPGTARSAGRWPAVPGASWRISCQIANPTFRMPIWPTTATWSDQPEDVRRARARSLPEQARGVRDRPCLRLPESRRTSTAGSQGDGPSGGTAGSSFRPRARRTGGAAMRPPDQQQFSRPMSKQSLFADPDAFLSDHSSNKISKF